MHKMVSTFLVGLLGLSGCADTTVTDADRAKIAPAILKSDDYLRYKEAFQTASAKLVKKGTCTEQDLNYWGGWTRSVAHKPKPVYFTYCGGATVSNRIYINTESREIFQ
ncbi:CCDC34 family protein [Rhizobium halophilum]|uniref:CCDC34 family protein n=1 Tax=Rhizobium halophilum TaxID=2846852 RepID=UPI001EFEA94D|nr:CCDC34 family protein [Rhizobium halophilum]MCF6370963.1 CCDC34 family protein [Rhizobium halophilum]